MMTQNFLPFKLEKTNDEITPRAGLALFGEFMRSLNLLNDIDRLLPKPGSTVGYSPSEFIDPIILMLQGGGKTLEDLRQIRLDTPLQKILGIEAVPSSDAAGDWLRRMAEEGKGLNALEQVSRLVFRRTLNQEATTKYTLDIDATQIIAEKRDAKMTYKGEVGYMPIVGHLAENSLIIGENFRDGNEAPQAGNLEFIRYCVRQLPSGKCIAAFRSDSAGYQAAIINYCAKENILFAIGADLDSAVKDAIKAIPEADW
ncbi:MAG: IS1380 family transposase, partial [Rectinemataceae bacterium]|nr:IS1380 family transposase [Rectinemataceae bacterium]